MFEIIFLTALSLYFLQLVIFIIGASKKYPKLPDSELPFATVIVAARNEENNILDCIKSLDELTYPQDKIEIIIVNDNSTDKTGEIIEKYIEGKPKFKTIVPSESIGNLKGKTNALANAIKLSKGDIILTTDADCIVSPTWARTIASYFTKDVGLVGGFTTQQDKTVFQGMQAVDFIYLLTVASGAVNLKKPLSCIGNNMAYRRDAYIEIGGYEGLPFSVTEDFNLLMAIHKLKKYKIIYPLDKESLVVSKPCPDWKTLYWQKKRWGVGGINSGLIGYLVMTWGFISHVCMLLLPFFFSAAGLFLTLFKFCIDYFFVSPVYKKLKIKLRFIHFLAFEFYFIIYVILLPLIVFTNRKVVWKGRQF
jgi:cellulose synthase/poly-beta-1,6-N-acetylglucosamine synthase-like glycosyltransferase